MHDRSLPAALSRAATWPAEAQAELAAAEDEWLELEMIREEIEGT